MNLRLLSTVVFAALAIGAAGQTVTNTTKTAYTLVKDGNLLVAPQARYRLREIRSEKSKDGLMPKIWYIDYLDSTTTFKTTEVKFIAGEMAQITHPDRLSSWFSGARSLSWKRLKVDSDRALAIALKEPDLKNLDLKSAQFWLEPISTGAEWRIRFWTPWPGGITDVHISAENGKVNKIETHGQKREKARE